MAFANVNPTAESDGILYANAVPLTANEATLGDGVKTPDPIATAFGQSIVAVIQLSITGHITGNNTYVVLQMDMGDGVWVDLNWIVWTGTDGSATFVMSNGVFTANSFQQSRNAGGTPTPQAAGQNAMCLGGRMRFVGKSTPVGGSSNAPGLNTNVIATIRYKLLGLN